jgi:hypothetical protein
VAEDPTFFVNQSGSNLRAPDVDPDGYRTHESSSGASPGWAISTDCAVCDRSYP